MKYVCTICGYIYDEAEHDVKFSELPDSWTCPLCGAPKALFEQVKEKKAAEPVPEKAYEEKIRPASVSADDEDMTMLSPGEMSALFSNLARGCEKQYQNEAMECFMELADYFEAVTPDETDINIDHLAELITADIDENYKNLISEAEAANDRGTLRVTTWGEKVTRMAKTLIDRYKTEGEAFLENTGLYICTVCGFLFVGNEPPKICPVCKVPDWKFEKIEGRAF